jgi:hypothetical protein
MSALQDNYDEYWEDIKTALCRPLPEKALVARLKKVIEEEPKLQKILEYYQTKNIVGSHQYGSAESPLVLYFTPDHVRANSVPAIKPPGLEMSCISGQPTEDAKENGEVNSSTPQSPQSKSTPVTPVKGSPGANHLNRPMSDSLRQKLKRRRPLHSPTKSSGGDEVSLESPLKKQRTSLHGPPRSIHSGEVPEREKERRLRVELFEKKSSLDRLKKKIQTKKSSLAKRDEIEHLTALIDKWRSVSQEALMELLAHQNRQSIEPVSLGQLLQTFHIEPSLLSYSADIDAFK